MNVPGSPYSAGTGDLAGRTARLMAYILLAVVLMTLDFRGRHVDRLRTAAVALAEPVMLAVDAPFLLASTLRQGLRERAELLAERDRLERQLREARARELALGQLAEENAELRELLDASRRLRNRYLTAELRNIDLNPYSHRVYINRGQRHGVRSGQAVIEAAGVVGQIDQVAARSATVILLSDPDHALPVLVQRTGLRTIAYGSGRTDELRLTDLPMNVDLQAGDILLTSGLGGRFPTGLPVAEVFEVRRPSGEAFASAQARPLARLGSVRHLLVIELETPGPLPGLAPLPETMPEMAPETLPETSPEARLDRDTAEP